MKPVCMAHSTRLLIASFIGLACSTPAAAAVTLLTDPTGLPGGPHTLEDFEDTAFEPGIGYSCSSGPCVRRTAAAAASGVTPSGTWGYSPPTTGPYHMAFDLVSPATVFGLWFGNDSDCCSEGFDATLALFDGDVPVGTVTLPANLDDRANQFIGFQSDELVTRVVLTYVGPDGLAEPLVIYVDDVVFNLVARCGNGVVEPGEGCDDGNLTDGDCCDDVCQVAAPDGTFCNGVGNVCGPQDTCSGGTCVDAGSLPDGASCDDGVACNGADVCYASQCYHADHCAPPEGYKCYRVRDLGTPRFRPIPGLEVTDTLLHDPDVQVRKVAMVCTPAATDGTAPSPSDTPVCCYTIKGEKPDRVVLDTDDAFGSLSLAVTRPDMLCQPCDAQVRP